MIQHYGLPSLLQHVSRRDVLRVSAGAGLSFLLPSLDLKAAGRRGPERPKSLITLWMAGGPSQLETWDPHPRSVHSGPVQAIKTTVPELEISDLLPRMAEQMHRLSVIRSLVSKEGDHERGTYFVQTGYRPDPTVVHPALTALVSKYLPDDKVEIPMHVSLAGNGGVSVPRGGYLGAQYDAFRVFDPGNNVNNMKPRVGDDRQQRRLEGLEFASGAFRRGRSIQVDETLHQHVVERALTMMSSAQLKAFSLDEEPQSLRDKYGDHRFGRGCLAARRLVEQGVRAVQVELHGFDTHTNNFAGQQANTTILDPAFATLMEDLADRDLLDSTIVLCIGEFGRTPWLNPLEGRDHWPVGFSCVIGGGGIRSGQLIGATDPDRAFAEKDKQTTERTPPSEPIEVPDLYATILTLMGLDPHDEIHTPIGRPIKFCEGSPIERLLPENLA